jgi:hypothetical protein
MIRCQSIANPSQTLQSTKTTTKFTHSINNLKSWLNQHHAKTKKVQIVRENKLYTNSRVSIGEEVVSIPSHCLITVDLCRLSPIGILLEGAKFDPRTPQIWIALFLLQESQLGLNSLWASYINTLPQKENTTLPLCTRFSKQEEINGYLAGNIRKVMRCSMASDWLEICRLVPDFVKQFTLDDFYWAMACVISRSFVMPGNNESSSTLVPLLDLLPISSQNSVRLIFQNGCYAAVAHKNCLKASSLSVPSVPICNARCYIERGVSLIDNQDCNQALLDLQFLATDSSNQYILRAKYNLLENTFHEDSGGTNLLISIRFPVLRDNTSDDNSQQLNILTCLSYLRILVADAEELNAIGQTVALQIDDQVKLEEQNGNQDALEKISRSLFSYVQVPALREANERLAISKLAHSATLRLQSLNLYGTNQDISNVCNSEREVLQWCVDLGQTVSQNTHNTYKKLHKSPIKGHKAYANQFWGNWLMKNSK